MSVYDAPITKMPLYDGASTTLLEALAEYMLWFSEHSSISKEALSDILHLQHNRILPAGNVFQRSSLFRLVKALTRLFSEKHEKMMLPELREEINVALALMERDFPVTIQVR